MYNALDSDLFDTGAITDIGPTKQCKKCHQTLPIAKFLMASGGNYTRSECRDCERELNKVRAQLKKSVPRPPDDYACPICERTIDQIKGRGGKQSGAWCCDHNHTHRTFRGWLCHDCNRSLGIMEDNVDRLRRAIKYLESNSTI